jgi:hypothetical protein
MNASKTKYLFDHVEKTAGNSLRLVFESMFGKENVLAQPQTNHRQACFEFKNYQMIMAHFFFLPGEQLDPSRSYLTVLREPIDRAISHFFFTQQQQTLGQDAHVRFAHRTRVQDAHVQFAKSKTISEMVSCGDGLALEFVSNFQTRHFMQLEWDGRSLLSEADKLELAKKALNRYALVGTYEYLSDFIDVFCYEGSHPPARQIPRSNITSKRARRKEIDSGLRERLEELNWADMELWRYATGLFLDHKRKMMVECITASATGSFHEPNGLVGRARLSHDEPRREDVPGEAAGNDIGPADFGTRSIEIVDVQVWGELSQTSAPFCGENVFVRVIFRSHQDSDDLTVGCAIRNSRGDLIYGTNTAHHMYNLKVSRGGEYYVDYKFKNSLGEGSYTVDVSLHRGSSHLLECYHWRDRAASFSVEGSLGYHFEGTTDLCPSVNYGVIEGEPGAISGREFPPTRVPPIRFTRDTPMLKEFRSEIRVLSVVDFMLPLEIVGIEIELTNNSSETWHSSGLRPVSLSYHWIDEQGNMIEFNGVRTSLPRDIRAAETFRVLATVRAPEVEGTLLLQFTLVQEYVAWFDEQGVSPETIQVRIGRTEIQ